MSNKAISNSNPEIHVQNGNSNPAPEPILVGSANAVIRFLTLALLAIILILVYFGIEAQKGILEQGTKIGVLQEKVNFLEDLVINKAYKIERIL